jgi:hypothetical protein
MVFSPTNPWRCSQRAPGISVCACARRELWFLGRIRHRVNRVKRPACQWASCCFGAERKPKACFSSSAARWVWTSGPAQLSLLLMVPVHWWAYPKYFHNPCVEAICRRVEGRLGQREGFPTLCQKTALIQLGTVYGTISCPRTKGYVFLCL